MKDRALISLAILGATVAFASPGEPPQKPPVCVVQPSVEMPNRTPPSVPQPPGSTAPRVDPVELPVDPRGVFSLASWADVRKTAAAQRKPVFVFITSDNCPPCKAVESLLSRDVFQRFIGDRFVAWREDVKGNRFGATATPTQIVYAWRGDQLVEVSRRVGLPTEANAYWLTINRDWRATK